MGRNYRIPLLLQFACIKWQSDLFPRKHDGNARRDGVHDFNILENKGA